MNNYFKNVLFYSLISVISLIAGLMIGHYNANKLSKKVETTSVVTTEVKKQDISTVQQTQKDSTLAKETIHEIISYSHNGKISKREFIQDKIGTRTQIGTHTAINDVVLDLSSSNSNTTKVLAYQSNFLVMLNYQIKLNDFQFDYKLIEIGMGYRLLGDLYATAQTNTQFNEFKIGGILLL